MRQPTRAHHVTERVNYLFLAHSKLRHCAFGPELRLGALQGIRGVLCPWKG